MVTTITTLAAKVIADQEFGFGDWDIQVFNFVISEIVFFGVFGIIYTYIVYMTEVNKEERQYQRMHAKRMKKSKPTKDISGFKLIERTHELTQQPETASTEQS